MPLKILNASLLNECILFIDLAQSQNDCYRPEVNDAENDINSQLVCIGGDATSMRYSRIS